MLTIDSRWLSRKVNVAVIGAGGSGSHVAPDLAVLSQAMVDLGHPAGLEVTLIDADTVSAANVGRARFYACDIGQNKARVLAHRINMCHGASFTALAQRLEDVDDALESADVVFGCVDTRSARRTIHGALAKAQNWRERLWIDLGNGAEDGQVIAGAAKTGWRATRGARPPTVVELFPEMLDEGRDPEDDGPSCSRAEAITKQGVFVNKAAAMHAVNMLATLVRFGRLEYSGVFFNTRTGRVSPMAAEPSEWERFGYSGEE